MDCHYSGTMRGSSRTERLQRWAAAGGGAGQESSVSVLAQGQEELRPEATVDFVPQKLWDTGGEEMPVLVRWKAGARKSWELLRVLEQRHFAAAAMVEVIVLIHTQLPKPQKEKACKDTPPETCSHNFLGPSQHPMSAGQVLLSPNSLAISHSFPCLFKPPLLPEQDYPFKRLLTYEAWTFFFSNIYWLSRLL